MACDTRMSAITDYDQMCLLILNGNSYCRSSSPVSLYKPVHAQSGQKQLDNFVKISQPEAWLR